ncbi:unnamed protein product, partial [Closterium sp. Naga37s-1]
AAGCKSLAEGRRFIQAHYKNNPAAAAAAIACLPPSATVSRFFFSNLPLFPPLPLAPPAISTASLGGASAALDISSHPGCDLLSPKERELCTHMRLLPAHYLWAKQHTTSGPSRSSCRKQPCQGGHFTGSGAPTLSPAQSTTGNMCVPCCLVSYTNHSPTYTHQVILQQAALSGGAISRAAVHRQAALSGGAISRAAVNRLFRLPPATTDNMCVPGLVSHTILPSSAHPIRSSYSKQPCQEAPSHEQRCTDSSACPPPPLMPFLDSFWELAGLLKLGGTVLVVGWEGQW